VLDAGTTPIGSVPRLSRPCPGWRLSLLGAALAG
jgi:hypothetical protein